MTMTREELERTREVRTRWNRWGVGAFGLFVALSLLHESLTPVGSTLVGEAVAAVAAVALFASLGAMLRGLTYEFEVVDEEHRREIQEGREP